MRRVGRMGRMGRVGRRSLLAPDRGYTIIATGGAKRNPWGTGRNTPRPRRGRIMCWRVARTCSPPSGTCRSLVGYHGFRCAPPVAIVVRPLRGQEQPGHTLCVVRPLRGQEQPGHTLCVVRFARGQEQSCREGVAHFPTPPPALRCAGCPRSRGGAASLQCFRRAA